jgi:hypothetical protein
MCKEAGTDCFYGQRRKRCRQASFQLDLADTDKPNFRAHDCGGKSVKTLKSR